MCLEGQWKELVHEPECQQIFAAGPELGPSLGLRELFVGLISGTIVAAGSLLGQMMLDDARSDREDRRENVRFVRGRSSQDPQERPFRGLDLEGQNMSGLKLQTAVFDDANLTNADFSGTELRKASFNTAKLANTLFVGADLTAAHFEVGANLTDASFGDANLTNTNFITADLSKTDFSGRNYAKSPPTLNNTVFNDSDLRGADFSLADLTSAQFEGSFCYDEATTWPKGFAPPIKEDGICSLFE